MSDIQEEQKRLYKRAEENDIKLLQEENNKYKEKIMILKEIVATYEIDKSNEYKFIEDLKRILWDKDESK
jgi:hypothetical protein